MDSFGPCFLLSKVFLVSFRLRKRELPSVDYTTEQKNKKKSQSHNFLKQLSNLSRKALGQKHKGQINFKSLPCCQETANVNLNTGTSVALRSDREAGLNI